ncbi:DUF4105 domain-containing protein [Vitiosangium sp. GDMCC 1.1324]|uniref:lipoprotein N-acyltransferase Lnb domain-containing protein n=1 Tax=Vitiosangium sp. (strain GDMCC 1.1324) TaxID=2138576 RepID=UPI000D348546|nr:DUF4105 domain-containing protein [Vitiosangium sp. GDMCC 1.1324]PTL82247.1 hypothetical protein DAT35_20885 [Vitiosangium sp. GDMCC 1.1324]
MRALVVLAAGLVVAGPAAARTLAERVRALEVEHGLVLRAPASEDAALVTEVEAGLAALPPALRRPPGEPLELVLHPEPAPLGMGNDSERRPDWSEGRRRFHLYAFVPSRERRATLRTARLTDAELERLWRRRAVVHAVMQRWDDARRWSRTPRWRRLSGWILPFERPLTFSEESLLTYEGAFSRARGQKSASLDLVTFAEELFVPVESLREEALSVDDQVRCQEFSKARALGELLAADGFGTLPPRGTCPAFDAWARAGELSHFELLLVASTGRQPESLFGHLLMRPVWHEGEHPQGPGFEAVVQPVALTGSESGGPRYIVRGLSGAFSLGFLTLTLGDLAHETVELEQRTIRRFRMRLTPSEQVRLLERVWEMERRGYMPYYFLTDNCASALLFLVNGALEGERKVHRPGSFWVVPGATLDAFAQVEVTGPDGKSEPLLEHIPDNIESTGERALRAHESREETLEQLATRVGPEVRARLRLLNRRLQSSDPEKRHEAWTRMPALVEAALASAPEPERESVRTMLHAYIAWSVRVERAEVDRAEDERLKVERNQLVKLHQAVPTTRDEVHERQLLFEREDVLQRRLAALDRVALFQQMLATADRREPTPEEARTLARAEATEATFVTATEVQGGLHEGPLSEVDPLSFLERDHAMKVQSEQDLASRSLPTSGAARTAVLLGMDFQRSGQVRPVVGLRTAGLSEALGESYLHGFRPSSELRVLDGEIRLEPRRGLPRVLDSRLTLLGYRTLLREPPWHRRTLLDELGWGMEALLETEEEGVDLPHRATAQAEALLVMDEGPRFQHYAALGVGARAALRWGLDELAPAVGPRFSFSQRVSLPGPLANAVRLEAAWSPTYVMSRGLRHEAEASLRLDLIIGQWGRRSVRFSPRAQVRWEGVLEGWPSGQVEPRLDLAVEVL